MAVFDPNLPPHKCGWEVQKALQTLDLKPMAAFGFDSAKKVLLVAHVVRVPAEEVWALYSTPVSYHLPSRLVVEPDGLVLGPAMISPLQQEPCFGLLEIWGLEQFGNPEERPSQHHLVEVLEAYHQITRTIGHFDRRLPQDQQTRFVALGSMMPDGIPLDKGQAAVS